MLNIDLSFVWVAANLLILYLLLRKFLFGRVGDFIDKRTAAIEADIESGKALREEGEAYKKQQESMLGAAREDCAAMLDEARGSAQRERDAILADARRQAAAMLEKARGEAAREQDRAYGEIKAQAAALAILAASKVIEANMDTAQNRALVEQFIDRRA
ncbi:MAG: F0F1 ATP synthase subunit B [Clostridiales bacterium]|jgi:F-type H+-transporting ATPase subunit b|nr:F0F1 ATP synthase subunit B [Clostridiales bacterium]